MNVLSCCWRWRIAATWDTATVLHRVRVTHSTNTLSHGTCKSRPYSQKFKPSGEKIVCWYITTAARIVLTKSQRYPWLNATFSLKWVKCPFPKNVHAAARLPRLMANQRPTPWAVGKPWRAEIMETCYVPPHPTFASVARNPPLSCREALRTTVWKVIHIYSDSVEGFMSNIQRLSELHTTGWTENTNLDRTDRSRIPAAFAVESLGYDLARGGKMSVASSAFVNLLST